MNKTQEKKLKTQGNSSKIGNIYMLTMRKTWPKNKPALIALVDLRLLSRVPVMYKAGKEFAAGLNLGHSWHKV